MIFSLCHNGVSSICVGMCYNSMIASVAAVMGAAASKVVELLGDAASRVDVVAVHISVLAGLLVAVRFLCSSYLASVEDVVCVEGVLSTALRRRWHRPQNPLFPLSTRTYSSSTSAVSSSVRRLLDCFFSHITP